MSNLGAAQGEIGGAHLGGRQELRTVQLCEHLLQVPSQPLVGGDKHGEAVLGHAPERLGWVNLPLVEDVVD